MAGESAEKTTAEQTSTKKNKMVTFYLYDENGNLSKRYKFFYSPFNVMTRGRDRNEDTFLDPIKIEFNGGVFETDDPQLIEACDAWNSGAKLSNGKYFKGDKIHRIKRDKPHTEVKEKLVKETIEIQILPRVIIETFTFDQLKSLCQSWNIEIPTEFKGDNVKDEIIKLLDESGHIKN